MNTVIDDYSIKNLYFYPEEIVYFNKTFAIFMC